MPADRRPAIERLLEAQARPASPGTTMAEIQQLLLQAQQAEMANAQAPLQEAQAFRTPRQPEAAPAQPSIADRVRAQAQSMVEDAPRVLRGLASGDLATAFPTTPTPTTSSETSNPPLRSTPTSSPDSHALERFSHAGDLGSAVQGAQEATPLRMGISPASGMFVIERPGVSGQIVLPLGLSPTDVFARLQGMSNDWQGTDTFGPNPQISPQAAYQAFQAYAAANSQLANQPGPPQGPLTEQSLAFEQMIQAPVSQENAARLALAQAAERQAQAAADRTALGEVQARGDAFGQRGALVERQAREMEQEEQAFQTELRGRMDQFESAIQEVQNRRVDPNRYFGPGAGGRIGAALAVALGEIGAGLTGRPNAALGIIESAINRDMQAQQADMDNARAAANMRGTAIQQMRSIIGDERGAQAAVRAAHYQAFLNQIDQQLTTASGANLQALQALRAAVLERIQAESAVAADRARFTARVQSQTTMRGRGGPGTAGVMRDAATAVATQDAAQSLQAAERRHVAGMEPEAREDMFRQEYADAQDAARRGDLAEAARGFQRILDRLPEDGPQVGRYGASDERRIVQQALDSISTEVARGIRVPNNELRRPTSQAAMAVDAARARLRRNPNDRGAREIVTAARREARSRGRRVARAVRAQLPQIGPWDPEEFRHANAMAQRHARYGAESGVIAPPTPPTGTAYDGTPDAPRRYAAMWASGETARRELNADLMAAHFLNRVYPSIVGGMEEFGAEVTATERAVAFAKQAANEYRDMIIRARSGAAITRDELDMYLSQMPDPHEITLQNVLEVLPDLRQRWEAIRTIHGERLRAILTTWGLTTDNVAGGGRRRQRQAERLRREATGPLPPEQSQSIQTFSPPPNDITIQGSGF